MSWAIGSVLSRKWQMKVDPFTATGWEMTFAAIGNSIVALATGQYHRIVLTHRALMAVLYLVVFGSWIGYSAYIWLLKHVPTPKVATYAYVNPLVAVFLGWLILQRALRRLHVRRNGSDRRRRGAGYHREGPQWRSGRAAREWIAGVRVGSLSRVRSPSLEFGKASHNRKFANGVGKKSRVARQEPATRVAYGR